MNALVRSAVVLSVACVFAVPAGADWYPGDPCKMTHPQLPYANWDVAWYLKEAGLGVYSTTLADDWECSQSGAVTDIHFWFSLKDDCPITIESVTAKIYDDGFYSPPGSEGGWNVPGTLRWSDTFDSSELTINDSYDTGLQNFFIVDDFVTWSEDHYFTRQCNIVDIDNPFFQQEGHVYWLSLEIEVEPNPTWPSMTGAPGWHLANTSGGYLSNSVYQRAAGTWYMIINPLWDGDYEPPYYPGPDLAFVITPEPATLALLALGGLALIGRRRA